MESHSNTQPLLYLQRFVKASGLFTISIGILGITGWIFNLPTLLSILPNASPIKFNTAIGLLCTGLSIWFLQYGEYRVWQRRTGQAFAILVILIGSISISEYIFKWDFGINAVFPGKTAPVSAICFTLTGLGLLLIRYKFSQYMTAGVSFLSLLALLGYLYDYELLYQLPGYSSMGLHTAFTFQVLSLAVFAMHPERGIMQLITSNVTMSKTVRFLLPVTILLIILLGWIVEGGKHFGIFDQHHESVVLVILLILIYSPLIYFYTKQIHQAETEIVHLNRLYATLSQVNQTIVRVKSQQELFDSICKVAVEFGQFRLAWIGLFNPETGQVIPAAEYGNGQEKLPSQDINIRRAPFDQCLIGTSLQNKKVIFSSDIQTDQTMNFYREIAIKNGYHSAAVVPIKQGGQIVGVLNLFSADIDYFVSHKQQDMLEEIGLDISFALDTMKKETERKQAEETLANSERRFRALIENGLDYISLLNAEGELLWESPSNTRMLGYKPNEHIGSNIFELVHPDDLDGVSNRFRELFREPESKKDGIFRLRHANGTWRWVEVIATNLLHVPSIAAIVLNYRDITERNQAGETLREKERQMRALVTSLDDIVFEFDDQGTYLNIWAGDENLLVRSKSQMLGRTILEIIGTDQGNPFIDAIRRVLKSGVSENIEYPLEVIGGQRWFLARISPIFDSNGTYRTVSMLVRDITKRRQVEEELRILNIELEKRVAERTKELNRINTDLEHANHTKDEFLANMSHELRTPLNSILGLSESLLEQRRGKLNESQQISLQVIEAGGRHLLDLINDILDLSKIEAGKFDFYPQQVSVDQLCRSSLNFIKAQASKKSIIVNYDNQSEVAEIFADIRRLKQVLVNLLTNAVKFTPENGHVTLRVTTKLEQNLIQFSVIDDGIGISPENLQQVFQPFTQVDSSLNRQHEGTGLGLALVQKLIDLHSGSVQVESEVGKGSCFTINLACHQEDPTVKLHPAQVEHRTSQPSEKSDLPKTSEPRGVILLAEDNLPNILTIGEYLESHDYKVMVAHDGLEAIAKARECTPDIILMDIQMPVMNGLEAIAQLRADSRFSSKPIIALTALAMPGDRERCLSAGADEYMSKPVSLKGLAKTIDNFLQPEDD